MRAYASLIATALLVAGCASTDPKLYTLRPVAGEPVGGTPRTIMLRRPSLAGYLDRPDIVRSGADYRIQIHSDEQWGEPLGNMLGRTLAEDIGRRLPGSSVYAEAGSISADPDATLEIDIQRFDADPGGVVTLIVQYSVDRGRGNPSGPPITNRLTVTPAANTTAEIVAAMSNALGQEADAMATSLRALDPRPTGTRERR